MQWFEEYESIQLPTLLDLMKWHMYYKGIYEIWLLLTKKSLYKNGKMWWRKEWEWKWRAVEEEEWWRKIRWHEEEERRTVIRGGP
jgi:hypothetical protein